MRQGPERTRASGLEPVPIEGFTEEEKTEGGDHYLVFNKARSVCLASEVEPAENFWSRMKGLLGRRAMSSGQGLWIRPSQGIHTIGMAFPIDVAYLDREYRILRLYHQLAPYRIAAVSLRARSILELPAGTLSRTGTAVGDKLEFQRVK